MVCCGCGRPSRGLCRVCAGLLMAGPVRFVGSGLEVKAAYQHSGLAQRLVHDLKYRAVIGAARALAPAMARNLPPAAAVLVPVPRSVSRRLQLGIDPALELANVVGRIARLPVERSLRAPLWRPRRAGKGRDRRLPVQFSAHSPGRLGTVIVDDVVTTGETIAAAVAALGPGSIGAITATSAGV